PGVLFGFQSRDACLPLPSPLHPGGRKRQPAGGKSQSRRAAAAPPSCAGRYCPTCDALDAEGRRAIKKDGLEERERLSRYGAFFNKSGFREFPPNSASFINPVSGILKEGSGPTVILLGIYINGFNYISEQSMDYEINLYLREQWWDPRLAFNETQLCGVEFMKLPDRAWDKIWVPDVFFRNEKKAAFHEVTLPNRLMRLYPNGTVYYAAKITATLSCQMKLHKYPLDTQVCPIQFESFGHTVKANVYQWRQMPVETDEQLILPQFELHATNTRNCQQTYA
uniref:Neur_chan_LBD domain-containing protein n=1 Tax=Macrostomum lignano TaxID=282301 RepID=A0A1I8IW54_9PLAT